MPNCFTLTRKTDLEAGPVPLNKVDEEMCAYFGVEVHPRFYCYNWFDSIGFNIAMGRSMEQQKEMKGGSADWQYDEEQLKALDWLIENFVENHWVEIGRR